MRWVTVADAATLRRKGRMVVKPQGRQIALFYHHAQLYACANRCPHEGYPLIEGDLSHPGCVLTCHWHNWKFDLRSGETLIGGDRLRRYGVRIVDGAVQVDLTPPDPITRRQDVLTALDDAVSDHDVARIARELARLATVGDPLDGLRRTLQRRSAHLEYGTTHAIAAAADWLSLRQNYEAAPPASLAALCEAVAHLAWDSLRHPAYDFPAAGHPWSAEAFLAALEAEDEARALGVLRGALAAGLDYGALRPTLARAALAHYADFGHAAIYVLKTGQLIDRLGDAVQEALLLALGRRLVYARREDRLPEFRAYGPALADLSARGRAAVTADDFIGRPVPAALNRAQQSLETPDALFQALLGAAGAQLFYADRHLENRTDLPVSHNVGFLDFTHAITFANAVGHLCRETPALWPAGLLQMACFIGRNHRFLDRTVTRTRWAVDDPTEFWARTWPAVLDHGIAEPIAACHRLKTAMAVAEECARGATAQTRAWLLAGLNRYLNSPMRRRHPLRTATQALDFIARE